MKTILLFMAGVLMASSAFAQQVSPAQGMREDTTAANGDRGMVMLVKRCDTAASTASADGKYGTPCMDSTGRPYVNVNGSATDANSYALVALMATTTATGAATPCYLISAASTNSTSCKASAGNFYGLRIVNTTSTLYYLRLYNLSTAPTCSSATGFVESIPVPHNTGAGGGMIAFQGMPINYSTGIGWCLTGGSSSTDNTNAATGIFGVVLTK